VEERVHQDPHPTIVGQAEAATHGQGVALLRRVLADETRDGLDPPEVLTAPQPREDVVRRRESSRMLLRDRQLDQ
jgi:hypothetical protein